MKPIGLRFKQDGELMIVHKCFSCGKISNNRIAGDDFADAILELIQNETSDDLLTIEDTESVKITLFGRK